MLIAAAMMAATVAAAALQNWFSNVRSFGLDVTLGLKRYIGAMCLLTSCMLNSGEP